MSRLPREDERIARLLDGIEPPRDVPSARLVAVTDRLRDAGRDVDLGPDADFRAALRLRLLAQAPGELPRPRTPDGPDSPHAVLARTYRRTPAAPVRPPAPPRPSRAARSDRKLRNRRRVLVSAALVGAALSGSTMVASHDSLPGQPLYKVKLTVENFEVVMARDPAERGKVHLGQARSRAEEIGKVAAATGRPDELVTALESMDRLTRTGVKELATAAVTKPDPKALAYLGGWLTDQRAIVDRTGPALPGSARLRVTESLSLLQAASHRVVQLEEELPTCECPAPPADELGPRPGTCPTCPPAAGTVAAPTRAATGSAAAGPGGPPGSARPSPSGSAQAEPGRTLAGGPAVPPPAPSGPSAEPPATTAPGDMEVPPAPADPGDTAPPSSEPEPPAATETPPPLIDVPGLLEDIIGLVGG